MKKSNGPHNRQRQRQKLSRRTLFIVCAFSLSCIVIGLTIFFNLSHVDRTSASPSNVILIEDQTFTIEKTMDAPVLSPQRTANAQTVFAKKAKPLHVTPNQQ